MKLFFFIVFAFIVFIFVWNFCTRKYCNPYKLTMVFGKKGCGKSTYLTKIALKHLKRGWSVYSTEPIPGTYLIDPSDIGRYKIPPNSVVLIDEVGMVWDNRDFKNFQKSVRNWFKLQRHERVKVYLFSQTFDIDKKLRDLTDNMYLLSNVGRVFSYGKKIKKSIVLNNSTAEAPSSIVENLEFEPFLFFWMGTRQLTYIPKYKKYFNSYEPMELPSHDWLISGGDISEPDN